MVFGSSKKGVLYLTDDSLFVYKAGGKSVTLLEVLDWGQDDLQERLTALLKKSFSSVIALNDTVDQHYRKERVPKVGIMDAQNVINRRLAMSFPEFPIRAYKKVGEVSKSKDDARGMTDFLFCACPDGAHVRAVVAAVRDSGVSFNGLSLLPMESEGLVERLISSVVKKRSVFKDKKSPKEAASGWGILVGQNASGGLRQIVVKDGDLALTRLSPIVETDADINLWCNEVKRELASTMGYLSRFGYKDSDDLTVVIIGKEESSTVLEEIMNINADIHVVSVNEASKIIGISPARNDSEHFANALHVGWAAKKRALSFSMKSGMINSVVGPRTQASAVAALLVMGLIGSMYYFSDAVIALNKHQKNLEAVEGQKRQVQIVYDKEIQRKEALGIDVKLIQNSFDIHKEIQADLIDPLEVYKSISRAMQGTLKLDSVTIRAIEEETDEFAPYAPPLPEGEEPEVPSETVLKFSFPGTVDIEAGNRAVIEFSERLKKQFEGADVKVVKILKDVSYKGELKTKVGVLSEEDAPDDLEAEILITVGGVS